MFLEIFLIATVLILVLHVHMHSKVPKGMPPGSLGLPVIGCPPLSSSSRRLHLKGLKKKYGNIFTRQWASLRLVVLADAALIRSARCNPLLQTRPDMFSISIHVYFLRLGVLMSSGHTWATNRKFMVRHLDVLQSSRAKQEMIVGHEVDQWIQHLESLPLNKPVVIDFSLNVAMLNVLFQMLASVRYEMDDLEMLSITKLLNENLAIGAGLIWLNDGFPGLHLYLPNLVLNKMMKVDKLERNRDKIYEKLTKLVEEHRKTVDPANPRDLIDHYLLEAEEHKGDPDSPFTDDRNLKILMFDVLLAGSETASSSTRWLVLYLALYPQIQSKVHACIDAVVPNERLPSLEDRDKLVYLDAVILDMMRLSSVFSAVSHKATEQTTLQGYTIPKDTMILSSLETCHRDPEVWEKPDDLYPEHFLDSEGKLVNRREAFLPFSAGKRVCPGEALARVELFLIASALLQRFTITPPPGDTLESFRAPYVGGINLPREFSVCLSKRI